jgi:4-amino-4-deoxy-L-arabinose transferase-like glycosyltransferase
MESPAENFLERASVFWFVAALAVVLFALSNLPWHLDDYDQAKQAFTSFEMVKQGHWIYQHTPNGWVATKPPLVGWFSAGLFFVIRSWELAWRLPSFLAGLALFGLIARAASVYGRAPALVAACAFGFNLFAPRLATLARTDMPLALVLFAIGWLIWKKIRRRETWTARDRVALFLLLVAGMLIKGPIVYAFLLPGLVAFQWRARGSSDTVTAWSGWWPWLASFAIFLAWVIGGIWFVPEFYEHVVLREFAGRFSEEVHRPQPLYFYFPHFLHRFAPWSLLLILLPVLALREQRTKLRDSLHAMSSETFWLCAWSLGGLLVMSLIPSKRVDRIFPVVPPLCLLLAAQLASFQRMEKLRRKAMTFCGVAVALVCLLVPGYSAQKIVLGYREKRDALAVFGKAVRNEAASHVWQCGVVGGKDEAMLLYVRQTEFLDPDLAAVKWKAGFLDGLVVAEDELPDLLPRLPGATPSRIGMSDAADGSGRRYIFLLCSGL